MTTTYRGKPACPCLIAWLPAYEAELRRRGLLKGSLVIYQLIGTAPASAGVHKGGGAYDIAEHDRAQVLIAREMGGASWGRTDAQGFDPEHQHGILRGCPHNLEGGYQITALEAGYNGLGKNGRGGKDDSPKPSAWRTWRQGIAWAEQQERAARPYLIAENVHTQFRIAADLEKGTRRVLKGVRLVQEALNKEFPMRTPLKVDGKVGAATLERWALWEKRDGIVGRAPIADRQTLIALGDKTKTYRVK